MTPFQAMLQFSRQMSWEKVSVIYAEDEYSLAITHAIDQKAETSGICFESYTKVTDNVMALNGDTNTTGFLVVSPPEDAQNITRSFIRLFILLTHILFLFFSFFL